MRIISIFFFLLLNTYAIAQICIEGCCDCTCEATCTITPVDPDCGECNGTITINPDCNLFAECGPQTEQLLTGPDGYSNTDFTGSYTDLCAGDYFFKMTFLSGCEWIVPITLEGGCSIFCTESDPPSWIFISPASCGNCDARIRWRQHCAIKACDIGSVDFTLTGPNGYINNNPQIGSTTGPLCSGVYTLTMEDGDCIATQDIIVPENCL